MIKLTLVKFIRQFSLRKSIKDFNYLFLQGIGLVLLALMVMFVVMYFYNSLFNRDPFWRYSTFLEKILYLFYRNKESFLTTQIGAVINYLIMCMAFFKLQKTGQWNAENNPRMLESFVVGLGIVFLIVTFLGKLNWLFPDNSVDDFNPGYSYRIYGWLSTLLNYLLPAISFYLAYYFLSRGIERKSHDKTWMSFFSILFLSLILLAFTNLLIGILMHLIIEPLMDIFNYRQNLVGLVLVMFISFAILIFYMITMADLLLILVNKKPDVPASSNTNPDLLDR